MVATLVLLWAAPLQAQDAASDARAREAALRPPAAEWQAVLAAEDARAPGDRELYVLLRATRSTEAELRRMAVRALGRLERPALLSELAPLLQDADVGVRAQAAQAVAQSVHGEPAGAARVLLADALAAAGESEQAAAALAESLGRLTHRDAAAARSAILLLLPHLDRSAEVRLGVIRGLFFAARQPSARGAFGGPATAALREQALARTGADANGASARALAATTLIAVGGADEDVLGALMQDGAASVRRAAIAGAAALSDTAAAHRLVQTGLEGADPRVRYEALRVYGARLAATAGCDAVVRAAGDADAHVALLGLDLLDGVCASDPRSPGLLRAAAGGRFAARVLPALARADPASAQTRLTAFLDHTDFFSRTHAARAAGLLGDTAALLRLAADRHPNVRSAAVQELSELGGHAFDSVYAAQLADTHSELLMSAAAALEGSTRRGLATTLLRALERVSALRQETSRDARRALLERAQELGIASLDVRVQPYLRDFDPVIAERAADVIEAWRGARPEILPQPLPPSRVPTFEETAALARASVVIEMSTGERIVLRLHAFDAPTNAARFARLARSGYFAGLTFHRVVPNFVVQGGSPEANEYSGDGPFTRDELGRSNGRGTLGLSTRGRDTGDGQFYINLIDNVRLDHDYTVFGEVVEGMGVADRLEEGAVIRRISTDQPAALPR
ncbi:MAG: peptidylprolyl isomerase [Gemmatimonadota bacterium]